MARQEKYPYVNETSNETGGSPPPDTENTANSSITVVPKSEVEKELLLLGAKDPEVGDELERIRFSISVMEEIARSQVEAGKYAKEVFDVAEEIGDENPVDLILEIAEWVAKDINEMGKRAVRYMYTNEKEYKRVVSELEFRIKKAQIFFHRLLRLDPSVGVERGIMDIPTAENIVKKNGRVTLDVDKAKKRLRERISGESFIEILNVEEFDEPLPRVAVGTDSSVGELKIAYESGSFLPPTPAHLFTGAAVKKVRRDDGVYLYTDYDLDPRGLQAYSDIDAAREGLLIAPHLHRETMGDFKHLRSAALELRQYREEVRVLNNNANWTPIGDIPLFETDVDLILRDGRLFPLVHRLDDFEGASAPDDPVYGEVVRREIKAFSNVFSLTAGMERAGIVYAGSVKAPEFSWLSMIVFWYLGKKRVLSHDLFYRPPLNDQAVSHLLFWGIAEKRRDTVFSSKKKIFVTFRLLRRFSDIAVAPHPKPLISNDGTIEKVLDENKWKDWERFIDWHIRDARERYDRKSRSMPPLNDADSYRHFLHLCHTAGVAMFYGAPTRLYRTTVEENNHFLMPRWEMAVSLKEDWKEEEKWRLQRLVAWLVEEDGLVLDSFHDVAGIPGSERNFPLFVPDVVYEAHDAANYLKDNNLRGLEDELRKLIVDIRKGKLQAVKPSVSGS